jgi:hypothetical protein
MKSFATLCLLAIATAVRLQKGDKGDKPEREGGCKGPKGPCMGDLSDGAMGEIRDAIEGGIREMGGDEETAKKGGSDVEKMARDGAPCSDIDRKMREVAAEKGASSDAINEKMAELGEFVEEKKNEAKGNKGGLAQKGGKRKGDGNGSGAESDGATDGSAGDSAGSKRSKGSRGGKGGSETDGADSAGSAGSAGSKRSRGGKGGKPEAGSKAQKGSGEGPQSESEGDSVNSDDVRSAKSFAKERFGLDSDDLDSENLRENAKEACKKLKSESEG